MATIWYLTNMTSNTAPPPLVASASANHTNGGASWEAFNGLSTGSSIGWGVGVKSGWLQIDFGEMFFEEYEIKMTEYPINNKNLLINNSGEILFNYLIEKKDYVLQDDGSLGNFNTITTNQKPLSIKFN